MKAEARPPDHVIAAHHGGAAADPATLETPVVDSDELSAKAEELRVKRQRQEEKLESVSDA